MNLGLGCPRVPQGAPGCPRVPQGARLQATLVCHSRPIGRTRLGRTMPRYDLPKSMQKTDFFSKETPSENIWRYLNIYIYILYIYMILYYKLYWHSISCCILQFFGLVTFLFFFCLRRGQEPSRLRPSSWRSASTCFHDALGHQGIIHQSPRWLYMEIHEIWWNTVGSFFGDHKGHQECVVCVISFLNGNIKILLSTQQI